MKNLGKILLSILVVLYAAVTIFLTACLLNYNDYKITEFGSKSLILINDEVLKDKYEKGSLLVVDKNDSNNIKIGEEIVFYNTYNNQVNIAISRVVDIEQITDTEVTYTVTGDYDISSEYLIGPVSSIKEYSTIGSILGVLESRIGFLIIIILPITLAFLYEIYALVIEFKEAKKEEEEEERREKEKKKSTTKTKEPTEASEEKEEKTIKKTTTSKSTKKTTTSNNSKSKSSKTTAGKTTKKVDTDK